MKRPDALEILALMLTSVLVTALTASAAELIPLQIGMGLDKPPYVMKQGSAGVDYEIADMALTRAGYKMVPNQFPQARALALMAADKLDGILSITEGIGGKGYFSENYVAYQNVAISLASRKFVITRVADLANYSVAGYQNAHLILGDEFKDVTANHQRYSEHAKQILQNRLLFTGRVDVVVADRSIFDYFTGEMDPQINAAQPVAYHPIFSVAYRQAVFRDQLVRTRFNAALKTMQQDGTQAMIYKKYNVSIKN